MNKRYVSLLVLVIMVFCSVFACAEEITYADTISWDGEYDVVVIGFGGAGSSAAVTAADHGAKVLLTEKCNDAKYGGNTRVCGQLFFIPNTYEIGMDYYRSLAEGYDFPEDLYDVLVKGELELKNWLTDTIGVKEEFVRVDKPEDWVSAVMVLSPEYPEKLANEDDARMWRIGKDLSRSTLFNALTDAVNGRSENIDVWFEAPAMHLIQDPFTKTVIGVEIDKQGEMVKIRARNGVVLACGGFENNAEMIECYLGYSQSESFGGQYNTGDGIRMAQEVGAKMWHMDVYEGGGLFAGSSFKTPDGQGGSSLGSTAFVNGSIMAVGNDGSRFMDEFNTRDNQNAGRHAHVYYHGTFNNSFWPESVYLVFDQVKYDELMEKNLIPAFAQEDVVSGTLEGLCEATGFNAEIFAQQIKDFNSFAENGRDIQYERAPSSMSAFTGDTYYAIKLVAGILNTQGGPMKNTDAQVLDVNDQPIPNLYVAGELGGVTAYQYQGGTNIAESLVFGQVAGKNAAAEKDPLPALNLVKVESDLIYMPGSEASTARDEEAAVVYELAENEAIGESKLGMGGKVVVKVAFDGEKITAIEVLEHNETPGISDPAFEKVPAAMIEAQSTEVDGVAGATMTSNALKEAVKIAIESSK